MLLAYTITKDLLYNKALKDRILKSLIIFLKNYYPNFDSITLNVSSDLKVNFKKFVSEELHDTFDSIYFEYNEHGEASLKSSFSIVYDIRSKILNDIKKEKYRKRVPLYISY